MLMTHTPIYLYIPDISQETQKPRNTVSGKRTAERRTEGGFILGQSHTS